MKDTAWQPIVFGRVYRGHAISVVKDGRRWIPCTPFDHLLAANSARRTRDEAMAAARKRVRMHAPRPTTTTTTQPKEKADAR